MQTPKMVLNTQFKQSLFKLIPAYWVIYQDLTVICLLTPEMQKEENAKLSAKFKAEGKGFLKSSAEMMSFWSHYHERFHSMTSEEVTSQFTKHYRIPHHSISAITFTTMTEGVHDENGTSGGRTGKIKLTCSDGKFDFTHQYHQSKSFTQSLREIYGEIIKIK